MHPAPSFQSVRIRLSPESKQTDLHLRLRYCAPAYRYSCCPSRITRPRSFSVFVTTKSSPSSPGEMVTKESEPSSFRRDATSLCHAPKSKLVFPAARDTPTWPSDAL